MATLEVPVLRDGAEHGRPFLRDHKRSSSYVISPISSSSQNIFPNTNDQPVIHPAESHPDVILYGIASRDIKKARSVAKKYNFKKAYGSYQELLDDPEINMVYISLPNSMHFEWANKALIAGKHVLCEKPFTSNGAEARDLVKEATKRNLVVEEAVRGAYPLT